MSTVERRGALFFSLGALAALIAAAGLVSCSSPSVAKTKAAAGEVSPHQRQLMDADWRFHLEGTLPTNEVVAANYDDRHWQQVQVPHDYVLDEAGSGYNPTNTRNHGYLPFKAAWYRKRCILPQSDAGKVLRLAFEGVFRDSQVWLNGQLLATHASGYTPFEVDITKAARYGAENVLAVRVDPRQFEGWWYEGGGIYRHVYLERMEPLHLATYGTYVTSTVRDGAAGGRAEAELTLETTVQNEGVAPAACAVVSQVLGPDGTMLETLKADTVVPSGGQQQITQHSLVTQPQLWSIEAPQLYQLRTLIFREGQLVDARTTTFGIRTLAYDPDKGFFLNGQRVEIRGTACHQDFAGLGIAVPDSLQAWRVQQLKKMGCNAWRTAHNPPSVAVLEACDRLGMLVMDENRHLGDAYSHHSPTGTTCTNLSDLACMIQRDRNHPSIIMWSMCNEEGLQGTAEGAQLFSAMAEVVRRYDRTRPITCAMNKGWLKPGIADVEDIIGVNYNTDKYDAIHQRHPGKAMFGSEDTNQKTTRGEYVNDRTNGMCSCYTLSETPWQDVATRPFMCGSFTWTGFDYKGEPNPYGWPDVSNNTGLMDSCGFPKDKYYYFESCWSDRPMVHLVPASWNWEGKEGQAIQVLAFSNAKEVELFLNGKSLGKQAMPKDGHVEWQVPYQPGTLVARAYSLHQLVATDTLETAGAPARIALAPERTSLQANAQDAVVVPVAILDAQGRLVPNASNRVSFHVAGAGQLLGVGNGNPADHDPDKAEQRNAFHGHCMAVVQAGTRTGTLKVTASAPGLKPATATFRVR